MLFLKLSLRNIFRQKRRSILTALSIMGSFVLCSVAISLVYGTYGKVIDTFTKGHAGHIQIHAPSFLERPSLFKNIKRYEEVTEELKKHPEIKSVSPRVISSVLFSADEKTTGGKLFGIDPELEKTTTSLSEKVSSGQFLSNSINNDIVLGHALAQILSVKLGDTLVLMTQAADGSLSNDLFTVTGILNESSDAMEARNAYVHLKTAQEFLVLDGRVHEIALALSDYDSAQDLSESLKKDFPKLEVSPWQEIETEFYKAMKADQTGIWIDLGIMLFIVSIGVLNTVLMTILERTKEFGILKAIGTRPKNIFIMVVLETALLASVSIFIGAFIALFINYKLSLIGIPYPMPIEIGGMALHHLYGQVSFNNLWIPAVVVVLSSIGVSVFPAMRAANIVPIKAIRST